MGLIPETTTAYVAQSPVTIESQDGATIVIKNPTNFDNWIASLLDATSIQQQKAIATALTNHTVTTARGDTMLLLDDPHFKHRVTLKKLLNDLKSVLDSQEEDRPPIWIEELLSSNSFSTYTHGTMELRDAQSIMRTGLQAGPAFEATAYPVSDASQFLEQLTSPQTAYNVYVIARFPNHLLQSRLNTDEFDTFQEKYLARAELPENKYDAIFHHFYDEKQGQIIIPPQLIYGYVTREDMRLTKNPSYDLQFSLENE